MPPEYYLKKVLYYPSQIFSVGVIIYNLIYSTFPVEENFKDEFHFFEYYD